MIDIHAHILPGLDDGPATEDEAIEMCRVAAADGISVLAATPHLFSGWPAVTRELIQTGVVSLRRRLNHEGITLHILAGAEVYADADLLNNVHSGLAMTLADGKYMLIEMSQDVLPPGIADVLFELHLTGICPVITHPERNRAIQSEPELLLPFIEAGNVVQITAGSLTGEFGREAEKSARDLVLRRMAHVMASDAHSARRRPPRMSDARRIATEIGGAAQAQEMFEKVPAAIITGEDFPIPTPVMPRRTWIERLPWLQSSGRRG